MSSDISADEVRSMILGLPEMAAWPEVDELFAWEEEAARLDWRMPAMACQAVGGEPQAALPAVGAIACAKMSCILVDDILDQDPRGIYRQMGAGRAANLALGLLAAAFALIDRGGFDASTRAMIHASLARMALEGASGQERDGHELHGEGEYWEVVRAKGSPYYAASLEIGALIGGGTPEVVRGLYDFGILLGEVIQIYDDLIDAFATPAAPDWQRKNNNLPILYALTADYPQRDQFLALLSQVDDPLALEQAQRLLIRCGAVSYCVYHIFQRYQRARQLVTDLPLVDPSPIAELLACQVQPVVKWLQAIGVSVPPEVYKGL